MTEKNALKELLIELGICEESSIRPYHPTVRDREDVSVLRCIKSGVIFLSRSDHLDISHYEEMPAFSYWSAGDRTQAANEYSEDLIRRKKWLRSIISNRKWLDIGTGAGAILDALSPFALKTSAVEPQKFARKNLIKLGYDVYPDIDKVKNTDYDVVTLLHVFEHFTRPIEELRAISKKMADGGKIVIEVPHANDFLLSFLDHDSFKSFTFWSEHLILHTRQSLRLFLETAGFSEIVINGLQRYPLANHLHWLSRNQPGGHIKWHFLRTGNLDRAYAQMLAQIDKTDTLIATAIHRQ